MVLFYRTTLFLTILGCALYSPLEAGKPVLATVDMAKVFDSYHLTKLERIRLREARAILNQDPRPESLRLLEIELDALKVHIEDPVGEEAELQRHYQRFLVKHHEYSTLKREHAMDRASKLKLLNESTVVTTRKLLNDIQIVIRKIAAKEGFDHVFETGGKTSSRLSSLIYIRNATDITTRVVEELNRERPEDSSSSP